MTRHIRSVLAAVAAVALASCLNTTENININPTHFAWIQGKVLTVSGQGVAFAGVGVRIPTDRSPLSYVLEGTSQSSATGDYELIVDRIKDVGALPAPDTLTVYVIAGQFIQGTTRLDSAQVTLQFTPIGQTASPQTVDVHTAAP
jgi:hypothetical protein